MGVWEIKIESKMISARTVIEAPKHHQILVMEGRKLIARARYVPSMRQWLIKAYGFDWIDPRARNPNVFGIVYPHLMMVKTKKGVREIFADLTTPYSTPGQAGKSKNSY